MRRVAFIPAVAALVLLAAGCGSGAATSGAEQATAPPTTNPAPAADTSEDAVMSGSQMSSEGMEMDGEQETHDESFAFGAPGVAEDADRLVDVETVEEGGFHYQPGTIAVEAGETVTFRVRNVGEAVHEFVLGDEATQREHEEEMQAMDGAEGGMAMGDEANALSLQPGATKTLTWTFTTSSELIYGCHEPGHYVAGMRGDLTVGQ